MSHHCPGLLRSWNLSMPRSYHYGVRRRVLTLKTKNLYLLVRDLRFDFPDLASGRWSHHLNRRWTVTSRYWCQHHDCWTGLSSCIISSVLYSSDWVRSPGFTRKTPAFPYSETAGKLDEEIVFAWYVNHLGLFYTFHWLEFHYQV